MRRREAFTLLLIFVLLFSGTTGTQLVKLAKANWLPLAPKIPSPLPSTLSILSPENMTYHSENVTLDFGVTMSFQDDVEIQDWDSNLQDWVNRKLQLPRDWVEISNVSYTLDGLENSFTIPNRKASLSWSVVLQNLSEGAHTLMVNASGRYGASVWLMFVSPDKPPLLELSRRGVAYSGEVWNHSEITFTVDASTLNISILSPENATYSMPNISVNFTANEPLSWIGYSLDGQTNVTISGNTTLPELAQGSHNLAIYAKDTAGNITSEIIYFGTKYFPAVLVVASLTIMAVVGLGLFVYFMKHKVPKKNRLHDFRS
jgi:hypothetical protein